MKRYLLLIVPTIAIVAVAILVADPVGAATSKGDPHKTIVVSVEQAKAILERVLPADERGLVYEGTKDRPGVRVHSFSGPDVSGAVDVSDGHIAILSLPVPLGKGTRTVTATQAKATALAFLRSLGSPVAGLDVSVSGTTGSGTPGYTIMLTHKIGNVLLPDYRMVEVDAITGKVFSLVDVRRPYDPPPPPRLDASQAEAAAVQRLGGGTASTPQLEVTFDSQGMQRLVWVVAVTSNEVGAPGAIVTIDALTGMPVKLMD